MGFYTRKGDDGKTGLLGDKRVSKANLIIEVNGCLDEANAVFGIIRSQTLSVEIKELVLDIQKKLYQLMTEVASNQRIKKFNFIDENSVLWIEQKISLFSERVVIPKEFIVPGDSPHGAYFDFVRTIVRRSERRLAELQEKTDLKNEYLLQFLNRLSSLCFILELYENNLYGNKNQTLVK
ncbi:MAG: cob(I)yrinic acid a,c-diamide adenosyltransferase [Anaerolineaceae bacterium]